jgi:peptidoglycan/LPS O-acetylase OafA/YrhL
LVLVSLFLWFQTVAMTEETDPTLMLTLAQATTFLAFVGGLLAALWHARGVFVSSGKAARALSGLWVLSFAILVVVGFHHHLLSFNPNY